MHRLKVVIVAGLTLASATTAQARTPAERLADFEAGFAHTGEVERCLQLHRIRDTRVIDERHILFRTGVSRYYLNTLPQACGALTMDRGIAIDPRSTRLCDVDWITAIQGPPDHEGRFRGPGCGLGRFERVERIDLDE